MSRSQYIIAIGRTRIRIFHVDGESVSSLFDGSWNTTMIVSIFEKLKQAIGTQRIRVLFDDDISYVFTLIVPKDVDDSRTWLLTRVAELVPEKITEKNWDFQKIQFVSEGTKMLIFAPNEAIWSILEEVAIKQGFSIEAVEPVVIAAKRHKNPVIGLAQKEDIRGDDDNVLNISASKESVSQQINEGKPTIKNYPYPKRILLLLSILVVLLCLVGIVIMANKTRLFPSSSPVSKDPITQVKEATPSATQTQAPIDLKAYSLQVLNGSGITGEAGKVADILEAEGFNRPETGNADTSDRVHIVVRQKSTVLSGVYETINRALNGEYTVETGDLLTSDSKYDVVIVVGK